MFTCRASRGAAQEHAKRLAQRDVAHVCQWGNDQALLDAWLHACQSSE